MLGMGRYLQMFSATWPQSIEFHDRWQDVVRFAENASEIDYRNDPSHVHIRIESDGVVLRFEPGRINVASAGLSHSTEAALAIAEEIVKTLRPRRFNTVHARSVLIEDAPGTGYDRLIKRLAPRGPIDPGEDLSDWRLMHRRTSDSGSFEQAEIVCAVVNREEGRDALSNGVDWHNWSAERIPRDGLFFDIHHHGHNPFEIDVSLTEVWSTARLESDEWVKDMNDQVKRYYKGDAK